MNKLTIAAMLAACVVLVAGCDTPERHVIVQPMPGASVPYGFRTDRPGLVKSPWNPNGPLVDVNGYAPGTVVRDPTTGRNFFVP